jgi:hypothetical protein
VTQCTNEILAASLAMIRDAERWRSMRRRLLAASIVSGRHDSGAEHHSPIDDACTEAYWDRLADHALALDAAARTGEPSGQ